MKPCTKCGIEKPFEAFVRRRANKDGLAAHCKACDYLHAKDYRKRHPEKLREQQRRYRQKYPEKERLRARRWEAAHREQERCRQNTWNAAHREQKCAQRRAHYWTHRVLSLARSAQWRAANPEKARASQKRWERAHPEQLKALRNAHRSRKRGAVISDLTHLQWIALQVQYDHRCVYCGKRAKGHLTQDHVTPLSKGGNHTASNIVPACRSCNSKKKAGPVLVPIQPVLLLAV